MLGDVLSDAMCKIEWYQEKYPENYDPLAGEIKAVVEVMDALLRWLDTPPYLALRPALNDLRTAIRQLDLSAVKEAEQRLTDEIGRLSAQQCRLEFAEEASPNEVASSQA
jgi:hypothetical protein